MGWRARWRGERETRFDGTRGPAASPNGASSFHLFWEAGGGPWSAAEATLEVLEPPAVPKLCFWALQVSFSARGVVHGGGHLGLQHYPIHPGSTAVNWGGYGAGGHELTGSESALPSAPGNPNTRDFTWWPGRAYRLRVEPAPVQAQRAAPAGLHAWRGTVGDLEAGTVTVVRDLFARGDLVDGPMVWSELFLDCDEPGPTVRWSDLHLYRPDGTRSAVSAVRVNYQTVADGGCLTTDVVADGPGRFVQRAGVTRHTPAGTRLS